MTALNKNVNRKVVPRWHSVNAAARQGEVSSIRSADSQNEGIRQTELARKAESWRRFPANSRAAELLEAGIVLGGTRAATQAAKQLVSERNAPLTIRRSAERFLAEPERAGFERQEMDVAARLAPGSVKRHAHEKIRSLKLRVRRDPRQPLAWAELARQYESINQRPRAQRAMDMALRLAPDNRFLLRSAARLALHHDQADAGHDLLIRSPRTLEDPWLLAAEIAMAARAERSSRLIKHGRRMLESRQFSPRSTAELASAIATEEMSGPRTRVARRLFEAALVDPTENAVAQAGWASSTLTSLVVSPEHLATPESYEARAWASAEEGAWTDALHNSWLWLANAPFSAHPGVFGSHQASLAGEFAQGVAIAEAALLANPDEFLLHNNRAFCLINMGLIDESAPDFEAMEKMGLDDDERATLMATRGFRSFRNGDRDYGRDLYLDSIALARNPSIRTIAALTLAREEVFSGTSEQAEIRRQAMELAASAELLPRLYRAYARVLLRDLDLMTAAGVSAHD
jgi:tetratricopeptide (TPR) repeat protein